MTYNKEFLKLLGKHIRHARKAVLNYSIEEAAARANIDKDTLQRIESGKSNPKGTTLNALEVALEIRISDITEAVREELRQKGIK